MKLLSFRKPWQRCEAIMQLVTLVVYRSDSFDCQNENCIHDIVTKWPHFETLDCSLLSGLSEWHDEVVMLLVTLVVYHYRSFDCQNGF